MKGAWVIASLVVQVAVGSVALACDVTLASHRPVVPDGARGGSSGANAWYGSRSLAALIPTRGQWSGRGEKRNFSGKLSWWRGGFDSHAEPHPDLEVTAKRLDGPAEKVRITRVSTRSNFSSMNELDSMQVNMSFPASGCWEVTGTYGGTDSLKFIFWVGD